MKRKIFIFVLLASLSFSLKAQWKPNWKKYRKELHFGLGASGFMGELGGSNDIGTYGMKDLDLPATRPTLSFGYHYRLHKYVGVRANAVWGYIGGSDMNTMETFRRNRNLHFRSQIYELSGQAELIFFQRYQMGHRYNLKDITGYWRNVNMYLYLFGGIGSFYFNPKAQYMGKWYKLRPLCTEGQTYYPTRQKYSLIEVAIPFGLGLRYDVTKYWAIGIEYGFRKTFTDYIDDVSTTYPNPEIYGKVSTIESFLSQHFSNPSPNADLMENPLYNSTRPGMQRGSPKEKDAYMFAFVTANYKIHKKRKYKSKY